MDPITALGVTAAAVQIAQFIGSTVQGLNTLKGRFQDADLSIRLLISRLSTIKAAVLQIQDWANYSFDESPKSVQFLDGLHKSLDGCQAAMDVLGEEVKDLIAGTIVSDGQITSRLGMRARARATWNHDTMKAHETMLHGQVQALQLLLLAGQCSDSYSQTRLMEMRENQRLIQRVVEDTATLRGSQSSMASQARSGPESTAGGISDFDPFQRGVSDRSDLGGQNTDNCHSFPRDGAFEATKPNIAQEYGSRILQYTANSPPPRQTFVTWSTTGLQQWTDSRHQIEEDLYNTQDQRSPSIASEPAIHKWLSSASSSSGSQLPRDKGSGSSEKRSWGSRLRRLNTFSAAKLPTIGQRSYSAEASLGSRHHSRKGRGVNMNQSIDFGSWDGLDTPALVRNAQAGNMVELEQLLKDGEEIETRHDITQRTALAVAAHCGAVKIVVLFIRHNAKLDVRDFELSTPLHLASSRGHCAVMALLLNEGVDLEATDINSQTPLFLAADRGYHKAAEMLLKRGAKINARASNQLTALHAATNQGDREMVELLLRHNAHIEARDGNSMTALHHACELGHYTVVEFLLQKGASIEARGKNSMSPLVCAAASGYYEVVKLLLKRKAALRSVDNKKANALHWASRNGHLEIAEYLLAWKMPIHDPDSDGLTAIHLAVLGLHFSLVDFLLQKNASVETSCREGRTPLHCACSSYSPDIVRLLLNAGARAEAPMAKDGRQPIHIAAANGSAEIIETLYERGASLSVRDASGDRALCIACSHGHSEVVEKLLSYKEPLRMPFRNRPNEDSPLCIAARAGHAQLVQLLIRKGASVKQRDEYGSIPLRYAAYYAHPEVVQVLLLEGAGLVDYGEDSGGLVMMLNPATLGFCDAIDIADERKRKVRELLNDALHRYENEDSDEDVDNLSGSFSNLDPFQRSRLISRRSIRHMLPSSPTYENGGSRNRDAEMWGGTFKPEDIPPVPQIPSYAYQQYQQPLYPAQQQDYADQKPNLPVHQPYPIQPTSILPPQQIPSSPPPVYVQPRLNYSPLEKGRPLSSDPAAYDTTQGREYYAPPNRISTNRRMLPGKRPEPRPSLPRANVQTYHGPDIEDADTHFASIRAQIAQLEELLPQSNSPPSPVFSSVEPASYEPICELEGRQVVSEMDASSSPAPFWTRGPLYTYHSGHTPVKSGASWPLNS